MTNRSTAREFWILNDDIDDNSLDVKPERNVALFTHVIEISRVKELEARILKLREALEFECDNTCARGIHPCNAREALLVDDAESGGKG